LSLIFCHSFSSCFLCDFAVLKGEYFASLILVHLSIGLLAPNCKFDVWIMECRRF
jgi:hypothetical protein